MISEREQKIILKHRLMDELKNSGALANAEDMLGPSNSEWRIKDAEEAVDIVLKEWFGE